MDFYYTPRDLHGSKNLFTGRTKVISKVFENIFSGRSIAIFGERQIGKTLLLWMIRDSINGDLDLSKLIDGTLGCTIEKWEPIFKRTKAVLWNLENCGYNEDSMIKAFLNEFKKQDFSLLPEEIFNNPGLRPNSMNEFLQILSSHIPDDEKLMILMDEMECLENFPVTLGLPGVFRYASNEYEKIVFIHAGSYYWEERIKQGGKQSPWNHLKKIYLGRIDENDARDFLIRPLALKFNYEGSYYNNPLTNKIVEWSGCKPLLIQDICHLLFERKELKNYDVIERELLKEECICDYIKYSMFEENEIDGEKQRILRLLSHAQGMKIKTISNKLNLNIIHVKNKVEELEKFDSIYDKNKKLRIVGTLFERFGKDKYDKDDFLLASTNPDGTNRKPGFLSRVFAAIFLIMAIALFWYTHPGIKSNVYNIDGFRIIIEMPSELEVGEEGILDFSIKNTRGKAVELFHAEFSSIDIEYQNNGSSTLIIDNIDPGETKSCTIKYRVRAFENTAFISEILIKGIKKPIKFETKKRLIPIKKSMGKFLSFLSVFFATIAGALSVWKPIGVAKKE